MLYVVGYWPTTLLETDRTRTTRWILMPLFGLAICVLAASNLSYLGLPTLYSTCLIVGASLLGDVLAFRRWGPGPIPRPTKQALGIVLVGTTLFLLPYAMFGQFPFLGD